MIINVPGIQDDHILSIHIPCYRMTIDQALLGTIYCYPDQNE